MKNPQAFPSEEILSTSERGLELNDLYLGMTLLDYFAGQALTSLTTHNMIISMKEAGDKLEMETDEVIARFAYNLAEAMLKEREKRL